MHEASLVASLLEQVRRLAQAEGGGVVTSIELELGPLSGVEPELVGTAFQRLAPGAGFERARLELLAVPLVGRCVECRREFEIVELRFVCPAGCGGRVDVVRGDGCVLKRFTLETGPERAAPPSEGAPEVSPDEP